MAGQLQEAAEDLLSTVTAIRARYDETIHPLEQKMNGRQKRFFAAFRFLTGFTILALPFYVLLNSGWDASLLRSLDATLSALILSALGIPATSSGSFIYGEQLIVDVTRDSTGWKSIIAFGALVLAAGRPLQKTVRGLLIGISLLFAANLLRITSMFYAVTVFNVDYEFLHTFLWRWGLTGVVLVVWFAWMTGYRPSFPRSSRLTALFKNTSYK